MDYQTLLVQLKKDLPSANPLFPDNVAGYISAGLVILFLAVAICWLIGALMRVYNVWAAKKFGQAEMVAADKHGQAELLKARNEQQIQVARAKGRLDAAELNKQAEIIDAQAVAQSVEIIGKTLHENEGYLRWKWIEMMDRTENATIYVPTEAGLPILEAGKRPPIK